MLFDRFKKKVVDTAKEVVKEEVAISVEKKLPLILGALTIGLVVFSVFGLQKTKPLASTIINNYYTYNHYY